MVKQVWDQSLKVMSLSTLHALWTGLRRQLSTWRVRKCEESQVASDHLSTSQYATTTEGRYQTLNSSITSSRKSVKTSYDILGVCETRRRMELNTIQRDGNRVFFGEGQGQRDYGRHRVCWQQEGIAYHQSISLPEDPCASPPGRFQQNLQSCLNLLTHGSQR